MEAVVVPVAAEHDHGWSQVNAVVPCARLAFHTLTPLHIRDKLHNS